MTLGESGKLDSSKGKTNRGKLGSRGKKPGKDEEPPFVLARHVLDFGNVVSGTVKTLKFRVRGLVEI